jgi:predicted 3-demethylubiquinone-9 3-methyltransferase (glyoxalase superfamily)
MNNSIYPCLIIKGKTAEAAEFYLRTFGQGKTVNASSLVVQIELSGQKFMILNDGPSTKPNSSISFMVLSKDEKEVEQYWNTLTEEGQIFMPLDSYDWSEKYGWVQDKYGVSWQIMKTNEEVDQKFNPTFMFTGPQAGQTKEAIEFYTSLFPNSNVEGILEYAERDNEKPGLVKHAQFTINDYVMMAMDSSMDHGVQFNDAISFVVECETQNDIDNYWSKLTSSGGQEVACGWLTDKFGVSWQIIPTGLLKLVTNPQRSERVMNAVMQMKKLIIADLEKA